MVGAGLCCASLEDHKTLMKMGLSMVLVGHINFLLGALVHGVVLRHINLHKQARAMEYAVSNVFAITSGLMGIVVGILAIILSKNRRSRSLTWSLFSVGLASAIMGAASAIGLTVSVIRAIIHSGRSLLTHCRFPDAISYSSITNECPFDPTRIYSTTLILWVPLIVTCVIQMVFCARCSAVCTSFLGLPCCPNRKRTRDYSRGTNVVRPVKESSPSQASEPPVRHTEPPVRHTEPPARHTEPPKPPVRHTEPPVRHTEPPNPPKRYTEPPKRYTEPPRRYSEPPRQQRPPPPRAQHLPTLHQSLLPSERRPLRPQYGERPDRLRQEPPRVGGQQRMPEHPLLERGTLERSSFWI